MSVGEVSREIYLSRAVALAEAGDREGFTRWQEDMQDTGPVFGVFWRVGF